MDTYQFKVIQQYPSLFSLEEENDIERRVTMLEIEGILKNFAKDKSRGPNGWRVEFFLPSLTSSLKTLWLL